MGVRREGSHKIFLGRPGKVTHMKGCGEKRY